MTDRIKAWRELGRAAVADCRVFKVEKSKAQSPVDGSVHDFYRILSQDWAQIVPVTRDDEIVMIRQYRHGSQRLSLEIPAGLVEPGEDPAAAAARECLEETGYLAEEPRSLGSVNPNPALFNNRVHSFVAGGVRRVAEIQNTPIEQTGVVLVPIGDLRGLLRRGEIDHALDAMTLWRFLDEI